MQNGGNCNNGANDGGFYLNANNRLGNANRNIGARYDYILVVPCNVLKDQKNYKKINVCIIRSSC